MTGTCRNGDQCPFRHSEGARATQEICAAFKQTGKCSQPDCGKRHITEPSARPAKTPSEVPCRYEEAGGKCTRTDCIYKHAAKLPVAGAQLTKGARGGFTMNAGARSFVPRAKTVVVTAAAADTQRESSDMEWTPADTPPAQAQFRPQTQQPKFGNKEWTPAAASQTQIQQPKFGNKERMPAVAPQTQTQTQIQLQQPKFGNKEWTPAAASQTQIQQPKFGNKEWTPTTASKAQTQTQTFGNKEWTPASATAPTPVPAQSTRTAANAFANRLGSFSKPSNSRNNSVFGSTNAFAKVNASSATNPAFKSTSAFGATKTQPPPANFSSSQTTSVNFAPSNCTNQSMPLPAFQKTTAVTRPLAVPRATAGTFMRAPVAAKRGVPEGRRLPTMYDILGIEPPKPKERDYGVRRRTVIPEPAVSAVASEPVAPAVVPSPEFVPIAVAAPTPAFAPLQSFTPIQVEPTPVPVSVPAPDPVPDSVPISVAEPSPPSPHEQRSASPISQPTPLPTIASSQNSCTPSLYPPLSKPAIYTGPHATTATITIPSTASLSPPPVQPAQPAQPAATASTAAAINTCLPLTSIEKDPKDAKRKKPLNEPATNPAENTGDPPVPKIMSFQEIMERKRRKKAAEAAEAAGAAATATICGSMTPDMTKTVAPDTPELRPASVPPPVASAVAPMVPVGSAVTPVTKRRMSSEISDELPNKCTKVAVTVEPIDYQALFERELQDMDAVLSGPLENSPENDRISRAVISDKYVYMDIAQLLANY
ncbi:hypothetical protein GGF37_004122 [Kickxella alabastrina]|nr:hypothetical protein GGF37_004122 [Kickxella alabastrina]